MGQVDAIEQLIGPSKADPRAMWRAALAEPDRRKRPSVDMNHPEEGFYHIKRQGKWAPLKIMYEEGELYGLEGTDTWLSVEQIVEVFSWAWDNPISEETYNLVIGGGKWPDLDEAVEQQMRPRGAGDNKPPEDERDQILIDIANATPAVDRYKQVNDDETAKAAISARNRLNELGSAAEKKHNELKAPFLAAGKKLDRDWLDPAKIARNGAKTITLAVNAWETRKANAQREQEKAAQRDADRAIAEGTPPSAMPAPAPAATPAPVTQIKGGYGRAATVVEVAIIEEVTDYRAALIHYGERESVRAAVMKEAATDVKNGHQPPGFKIGHERRVK